MLTNEGLCSECGTTLDPGAVFCQKCGTRTGAGTQVLPEATGTLAHLREALQDRYQVERELGRGGMATVYLANDIRHDRRVAIKVLHPDLAASVGVDRFIREIRVAAKLQHPHILTLYDSGEAGGLLYYVMPFVEGESLRDKLKRENMLSVDEAIGLTIEIAEALGYAHTMGIVHRDIKPENILLSNGHALVADFGIARAVSAAETHKLTQTGTAVGTPLYMSPEQGAGEEVGPTADLYSLGCMAFELLTGDPPFTGTNARSIMARHAVEAPPGIRTVRDTVPEEVEEAILWCLAKVPADRPKTAQAFIEAIATPLAATATRRSAFRRTMTKPRLSSMQIRRVPWWKRPAILAAAAIIVLAGGAGTWRWVGSRHAGPATGADPKDIAVLYFDDQSSNHDLRYLADGLTDGLIASLRGVNDLHVVSRSGAEQFRNSTLGGDSIAKLLGVGTLVRGSVEPEGANVIVNVRLMDGDVELYRTAFRQPANNPLAIKDSLASKVAELVRRRVGEEVHLRETRASTTKGEAWVLLQRGEGLLRRMDSLSNAGDTAGISRSWSAADSLFAATEALDPRWVAPITDRATAAYQRSRYTDDQAAMAHWIGIGLGHADRAIALDAHDPDALEIRGTLRYWKWLNQLERDQGKANQLLKDAQADLEQATTVNPSQAGAWASLSHLYNQVPDKTGLDINNAARRAMEEDAWLKNADVILGRLFLSSYDLESFLDARHWCDEGARRFPGKARFTECRLMLMSTRIDTPSVARAWRLADSLTALAPASQKAYYGNDGRIYTAAVLARAGLADSARHVLGNSLGTADVDPSRDLAFRAGFVYGLLGDTTAALNQLKLYLNANPARRRAFATDPGWWYRPVSSTPAFRQVVGTPGQ